MTTFPSSQKAKLISNYHEIHLDIDDGDALHVLLAKMVKDRKSTDGYLITLIPSVLQIVGNRSDMALKHPKVQQLLHSGQQFDLLVVDYFFNDFQLGLAGHFRCPILQASKVLV